jgi:hypothetical protein
MKTLMDRFTYWWGECAAAVDARTEALVVPPADEMMDRVAAWYDSTRHRLRAAPWMRGRGRQA